MATGGRKHWHPDCQFNEEDFEEQMTFNTYGAEGELQKHLQKEEDAKRRKARNERRPFKAKKPRPATVATNPVVLEYLRSQKEMYTELRSTYFQLCPCDKAEAEQKKVGGKKLEKVEEVEEEKDVEKEKEKDPKFEAPLSLSPGDLDSSMDLSMDEATAIFGCMSPFSSDCDSVSQPSTSQSSSMGIYQSQQSRLTISGKSSQQSRSTLSENASGSVSTKTSTDGDYTQYNTPESD